MSYVRSSSQEGLILALRSEVERLKSKINQVLSSAEMTLGQVQSEQEVIKQSFASKEAAYLREIRDRAASEAHFRELYDVANQALQDEETKARDNATMLGALRDSALGHPESKTDDEAAAARSFMAHPGQLVLRSTNSWAIEVAKLRRARESDLTELQSLREAHLQQERELAEARGLLEASRQETVAAAALLQEFSLAQTVLGKPKSRDQQLLGTIRQALSASTTKASRLVKKNLLAACDDEQAEARRQQELYQASLADLTRRWEEGSGEALPWLLEQLTERTAEARCLLQERSAELDTVRATLDRQAAEKNEVLQRLAEEHEHAARWKHDKDQLLVEQQLMVQETARSAQAKAEAEDSLVQLRAAHAALQASSDAAAEALLSAQRDVEAAAKKAASDQQLLSEQCAQMAALQREVADYARLIDGERVAEVDARLAELTAKCVPLEKELSETKARAFADAMSLRKALAEAAQQAMDEQATAADWRRKCEAAEGKAAAVERKWATEQSLAEGRIAALTDAQTRVAALQAEQAVSSAKLGHLLAAVDGSAREILVLKQQAATFEATRSSLESTINERGQRIKDRENLILDMQTAVDDLLAQVANLTEQLKEKTAWAEGAAAAHARETLALRDADRLAVSQAAQELAERAVVEGQLRRQLLAIEAQLESVEVQLRTESAQHHEERRRLRGDLESAVTQAEMRVGSLEARSADLLDQLAAQSGRAAAKEVELSALVEALRGDMASAQDRAEALLLQSTERATAAEATVDEARGNLDKYREMLREKLAAFQIAERACDETVAELETSKAALQAELEAVTESLRERDEELAALSADHAVLKDECAEMKPHILELLAETELAERQARDLERLEGQLQLAQRSAEQAEKALAEADSRHRTEIDAAAARFGEEHAHSVAKEARLKQIISTATEQLKVLEEAAAIDEEKAKRREDTMRSEWRLEVAELKTLLSQATRAHDEVLAVSKEERVFRERDEAALTAQIESLQADLKARGDRYREAEEKFRGHMAEQATQLAAFAERARKAEAQARHHERQAAASADEIRKRDAEVDVHKGASHELYGDLKAARRQYEDLAQVRQADQRAFFNEMEELRAASKAELALKCAALAAENEVASMALTQRLWEAERLAEAAEEKLAKEKARSDGSDERQATLQEHLRRATDEARQQRQRHRADMEALRSEFMRATAEQIGEQQRSHATELSETLKAHRFAAETIISELQTRCSTLEVHLISVEGNNDRMGALIAECAALQGNIDRETLKSASLTAELARASATHSDQCRDLQLRLDAALALASSQQATMEDNALQNAPSKERQAEQLARVRAALEMQAAEARAGAEKQADHHARLLSEAQRALAVESAALSQARAETVRALREQSDACQRVRLAAQEEQQALLREHSSEKEVLGAQLAAAERDLRATRKEADALRSSRDESSSLTRSLDLFNAKAAEEASVRLQETLLEVERLMRALEMQGAQHAEDEASWAGQVREAKRSLEEAVAAHASEVASLKAALAEHDRLDAARGVQLESAAKREEASRAQTAVLQSRLHVADLAAATGAAAEAAVQRLQEQLATERDDCARARQAAVAAATTHAHALQARADQHAAELAAALAALRAEAGEVQRALEAKVRAAENALREASLVFTREGADNSRQSEQERAQFLEAAKAAAANHADELAALHASHTRQLAAQQASADATVAQLSQQMADKDARYREQVDRLVVDMGAQGSAARVEQEASALRVSELEQASREFVMSVGALQRRVDEAVGAAADAASRTEGVQRELDAAREAAKRAEATSAAHEAMLQRAVQDLERSRVDDAARIRDLRDDLDSSRCEIDALTASLSESELNARVAVDAHTRKIEGLLATLTAMQNTLEARISSPDLTLADERPDLSSTSAATGESTAPFTPPRLAGSPRFLEQSEQSETDGGPGQSVAPDTPGFAAVESSLHPNAEDLSRVDASIAELRASMYEEGSESSASDLLGKLTRCFACYADLKALYLRCEDEYNNAARILVNKAESSGTKLRGRNDELAKLLDSSRSTSRFLKMKLVVERAKYREDLENLQLRLLAGASSDDQLDSDSLRRGESGEGEDEESDSVGSAMSETPSAFTINTEQGST